MDVTREARIVFAAGASGSGKSHFLKQQLTADRTPRRLIFDPHGEYHAFGHVTSSPDELVRAMSLPSFAVVWAPHVMPDRAQAEFNVCCQLALDLAMHGRPTVLGVDELQQVTTAGNPPPWWGAAVSGGRKFGLSIYAAAQRTAEIDKRLLSNASILRTGRLGYPEDQKTIARAMSIDPADVAALSGHQWIMRDQATGIVTRG